MPTQTSTNTVNVALMTAALEDPYVRIVSLSVDHPIIAFCERWKKAKGQAWIDLGNDDEKLIKMWNSAYRFKAQKLPCTVHHVVIGVSY